MLEALSLIFIVILCIGWVCWWFLERHALRLPEPMEPEARCELCNGWKKDPADALLPCPACSRGKPNDYAGMRLVGTGPGSVSPSERVTLQPDGSVVWDETAREYCVLPPKEEEVEALREHCAKLAEKQATPNLHAAATLEELAAMAPIFVGYIAKGQDESHIKRDAARSFIMIEALSDTSPNKRKTCIKYGIGERTLRRWRSQSKQ